MFNSLLYIVVTWNFHCLSWYSWRCCLILCVSSHTVLGVETARLVSQKAKGMPRIIVPLTKMVDSSASEAMANLSLELFRAFKSKMHLQGRENDFNEATRLFLQIKTRHSS